MALCRPSICIMRLPEAMVQSCKISLLMLAAKPIAATMTRTASTSGYELGLLAAAGCLTIIPGAFVIYFVRNYIAKGFALGRV